MNKITISEHNNGEMFSINQDDDVIEGSFEEMENLFESWQSLKLAKENYE